MIHRDAQTAFLRCVFPKRRNLRRTRNRDDLPCAPPSGKRILTAKTARKTDDFPKRLHSPRGTRAGDDRVPTHIMLRAALKRWRRDQAHHLRCPNTHHAACGFVQIGVGHKKALHLPLGERNAFRMQLMWHCVLTQIHTNDRIEIQKGHCLAVAP